MNVCILFVFLNCKNKTNYSVGELLHTYDKRYVVHSGRVNYCYCRWEEIALASGRVTVLKRSISRIREYRLPIYFHVIGTAHFNSTHIEGS